jgi:hypothetical protein
MIVSVINRTNGRLSDAAVQGAIRAINRQISSDFQPYWGFGAILRLEGEWGSRRKEVRVTDMRGEAIVYLYDVVAVRDAYGFHDRWFRGIPYGVVYHELSDKLGEEWTTTFSHEVLELIADPEANLLVQGPDPHRPRRQVFYWLEVCDPVQNESYVIDGVHVSNFVLPLYYTASAERTGRNDFLGTRHAGRTLRSFGANPGGYFGYFNPRTGKDQTYDAPEDTIAQKRLHLKERLGTGRGCLRKLRSRGRRIGSTL